jgi:hypothetical protein
MRMPHQRSQEDRDYVWPAPGVWKWVQDDSVSERKCFIIEAEVEWLFSKHGVFDSVRQTMRIV